MIYFLTTKRHNYTIRKCLASCGAALAESVRPRCYGKLFLQKHYASGTYIFSDLERLDATSRKRASIVQQRMLGEDRFRVLNSPADTLLRFDLLKTLAHRSVNEFDVYRLIDHPRPAGFPVFIRGEDDHKGPLSPLIHSQSELEQWGDQFENGTGGRRDKLVVEFLDVSDRDGVFRKYSAFKIGDRIIPRHLFFANDWCVKSWERLDEVYLAEEWDYVSNNPHHDELRAIFRMSRIDFGRIDYGVRNGKLQVWEINTNPMLPVDYGGGGTARARVHARFDTQFLDAMRSIDDRHGRSAMRTDRIIPLWRAAEIPARVIYRRLRRGKRKRVA